MKNYFVNTVNCPYCKRSFSIKINDTVACICRKFHLGLGEKSEIIYYKMTVDLNKKIYSVYGFNSTHAGYATEICDSNSYYPNSNLVMETYVPLEIVDGIVQIDKWTSKIKICVTLS